MRYIGAFKIIIIISTLFIFAGCNKQDEEFESIEESTVAMEESTEFVESVEEFEENGEKFYREIMGSLEMVYPRFESKISSKEEVEQYDTAYLGGGVRSYIDDDLRCIYSVGIKNIYKDTGINKVKLSVYNGSAYFGEGDQYLKKDSDVYRLCDTYEADLSGDIMATLHVMFEVEDKRVVKEHEKMASIVDKAIIQADITYTDNTTKTEYLSLGSYEGRHCNFMSIYRLEIEE